ncbi:hypothetical protein [Blattabacterium sp. (Cryptocercus kyebangensis)]|uniref:hypothetical protein n=1 Tax=Blattabacterium sp. (Cryptocercus kyebangensis) TaxID=298656 RepID=UPI001F35ED34|nr:hypothetical protein [Blattabacterium sp. (Cryptocercus kyebangensis)]
MTLGFFLLFFDKIPILNRIDFNQKKFFFLKTISNKKEEKKENKPWIGLYIAIFYFTTISLGSLLFLGIQYASQSGWSIIIHPIIEELASFIPYGCFMILIFFLLNSMDIIHIFHWMDINLYDPTSLKYDKLISSKRAFLNIPFFLIRSLIYIIGWNFFYFKIKKTSHILNMTRSLNDYKKLNFLSIIFIIFFSITSIFMGWDWIMSLNPHWFSTLFSWYVLSSYMVTGIGTITILSIYLKKIGCFPFFNENHLHDLSKYLFSSSLLWSYFWFSQFLLYWYGNIPEEVSHFLKREELYGNIHFWMLILNFLVPFFGLMSSKSKINPKIVLIVSSSLLVGHYIDIYNLIAPDVIVNDPFYPKFGLHEIGALLLIGNIFIYILFINLNRKKLNSIGHPFFQESKKYKYPYI